MGPQGKVSTKHKVGRFEKVSFEQYLADWRTHINDNRTDDEVRDIYDKIKLPIRSTIKSAGYDVFTPAEIRLQFGSSMVIPTGLRCIIDDDWDIEFVPRSGSGFKYGISLANTIGVIDGDYCDAKNQGHILIKLVNNNSAVNTAKELFIVKEGQAFCQGLYRLVGYTYDDVAEGERTGGFGSTTK